MTAWWATDFALVATTLVVISLCLAAIGATVRRAFGHPTRSLDDGFLAFWLGFSAVTWFLILWNFAFAIDSTALAVVAILSICCLSAARWSVSLPDLGLLARPRTGLAIALLVATAWVASQCLMPFQSWDGVLYHLQGVAWAKSHPAIPGIANLDGPLAFNNSSFLYDALLDSWLWETRGFHIAHGTLLLVAVLQSASAGLAVWRHRFDGSDPVRLFQFMLLPIALYYVPEVSTYSTDLPMALTLSAGIGRCHALLQQPPGQTRRESVVVLAIIFGAAIAIKMTAAVFVAAALVVLAWRNRRRPAGAQENPRLWAWSAGALAVYLAPWIARGIVLSGYPFFPLPYFGLPVEWLAPVEHARAEVANIVFTEREFSWHLLSRAWLHLTFIENVAAILLPSVIALLAVVLWRPWSGRSSQLSASRSGLWLTVPAVAAIAAWFLSAPSHRYAPVLFWTIAAVTVTGWLVAALPEMGMKPTRVRMLTILVTVCPLFVAPVESLLMKGAGPALGETRRTFIGNLGAQITRLPTDFPTTAFVTRSGLVLNSPAPRANTPFFPNACGTAPLPCTSNPAPNLEMREPGNLRKGFRVSGGWQMQKWPYPWRPTFLEEWRSRR